MSDKKMNEAVPDAVTFDQIEDPWGTLENKEEDREKIYSKHRTFMQDVWYRFYRKPTSLFGLVLIVIVLVFSLLGPVFYPYTYYDQDLNYVNMPPFFQAVSAEGGYFYITSTQKVIEVDEKGNLIGPLTRTASKDADKQMIFDYNGKELVMDYSAQPFTLLDADGNRITETKFMWNKTYILGADSLGRDMMARLMFGAQISMLVAVIAALTNLFIGVLYGSISAYCGGTVDAVMMRVVDIINTLPLTLYVIMIKVLMDDSGIISIIIALGTVYWVNMARVVRGEILSLRERDFVMAAKTMGSSTSYIMLHHLIPNAMGPILVTMTMLIPSAIFMEAFLSFIGLGIAAPLASLGTMCNDALQTLRTSPYQLIEPALLICILMFGFNFVGDGLRDALDPKMKK